MITDREQFNPGVSVMDYHPSFRSERWNFRFSRLLDVPSKMPLRMPIHYNFNCDPDDNEKQRQAYDLEIQNRLELLGRRSSVRRYSRSQSASFSTAAGGSF